MRTDSARFFVYVKSWLQKKVFSICKLVLMFVLITTLVFTESGSYFLAQFVPAFEIEDVYADDGDFAIYRESTGGELVTAAPTAVTWDSAVVTNSNIPINTSNGTLFDLSEGGKYLVMYNIWTEQGTAGGANRRSTETYLKLNGATSSYGYGSGYIRDSEGQTESYESGAAIIDATAGDDLEVGIRRTDSGTGGLARRGGTNGVTILKLNDNFDYLRLTRNTDITGINANTTFTDVAWNVTDEEDGASFTVEANETDITLQGAADQFFLVTANVSIEDFATSNNRQNYEMRFTLDGVEIPGTRSTAYIKGNQNSRESVMQYVGLVKKTSAADQTFNVEVRRESTGGASTDIIGSKTALTMMALKPGADVISLTNDTPQTPSITAAPIDFDEQISTTSSLFSHSNNTNPSRVTVNQDEDYLFFSTVYSERTVATTRDVHRIEWRTDGLNVVSYGGHGAYNRGNQTFTAGSSGGVLLDGLTSGQYIELINSDETTGSPDSSFTDDRVALQAVALNDAFFGSDVVVSAEGTQVDFVNASSTDTYLGGSFVVRDEVSSRNVTSIAISELGTIDAENKLDNIKLFYETSTTSPYDCSEHSYDGGEAQYGVTDTNGFSGANGIASFSDVVGISTTESLCVYAVMDVASTSVDGETIEIAIADPSTDVLVTGTGSVLPSSEVAISGTTVVRNAELTQVHYQWLNDDGVEGAATSVNGSEDSPALSFSPGFTQRLRLQVSAEGSTSSESVNLRLEYAVKSGSCSLTTGWTDVGAVGGDWDMSPSAFITDGGNSSDLTVANGGTTNENTTHLTSNGALRDTTSELGALTFASSSFLELEFAVEATGSAPDGTTYCFRVSDAGDDLRNYSVYPEATLSADVTVNANGAHIASIPASTTDFYTGGSYVVTAGSARTITSVTVSEVGSIDGSTDVSNIRMYYELDTTNPYDCASESYAGTELQFGSTDTDGFSSANGTSTFTGSVGITSTQSLCLYTVVDVAPGLDDGETLQLEIGNPTADVLATGGSVGPGTAVGPSGSVNIQNAVLAQVHYHWRNDDGGETDATSATGGVEDTPFNNLSKETTQRLRIAVSNEGSVVSPSTVYRLEYGTRVSSCSNVGLWFDVADSGGAWDMSLSDNITDGNTTDITDANLGAVTNENTTFVGTGALRETTSESAALTLSNTEFTELEFSIEATSVAGFDTTYCFRVTAQGNELDTYDVYAEATLTTRRDFFIQRGETDVSGTSTTLVAGVDYTAPAATSSAFVRFTNSQITGSGNLIGNNTQNADDVFAYISDQSDITSSFTISRPTLASSSTRVTWEIVEFIGIPGSDNEMIVRDTGAIEVANGALSATGNTITTVADDADVVVYVTGQRNDNAGRNDYNDGTFTADWDDINDQSTFLRGDADDSAAVSYAVVEFTGSNWSVQRVEHTYASAASTETETITAVPSLSKAFIHTQKRTGANLRGLDEIGHQVWLSSIGVVSFALRGSASTPSGHTAVAWVVANSQEGDGAMNVIRSNGTISSGGPEVASLSLPIGFEVNTVNASIYATNDSAGTGVSFPRPLAGYFIASSTHYEVWRSDTGQPIDFRVEVVEWPVAEVALNQNYYRFYVDNDALDPTDPWPAGVDDLGENTSVTAADDPIGENETIRLRMSVEVNNASLPQNTQAFKLQYGLRITSCSAILSWSDVGDIGSGEIWRGFNATPLDGEALATSSPAAGTLNLSVSDVAGTYEEENSSAVNPFEADPGEDIEFDWIIEHNGAAQRQDYCFRMMYADDSELEEYTNYPMLRTTGYTPVVTDWRWYEDEASLTPSSPLANENIAPIDNRNGSTSKLRVLVKETESVAGVNVKFALQFSTQADFSDGGTFVTSTSTCTATSVWCYDDGAGIDNVPVDSTVLTNADACVAGVGVGCGTHNESGSSTDSTLAPPADSAMEFEFTLQQVAAPLSTVYYFRLFDTTFGEAVSASSSAPSIVSESAKLNFTVAGVLGGTSIDGIVTDATTTPTSINFGRLQFNTDVEAAQQIQVFTNAEQGYQVLMFSRQELLSSYGYEIPPITSSNAVPSGWAAACPSSQTGCFGYHTTDATLFGGSSRFAPTDSYAAVSTTTSEEIIYSSLPGTSSHEIVYRISVTPDQVADQYVTDVVYIAVPVF